MVQKEGPETILDEGPKETAEHTIFLCPFWDHEREELASSIKRQPRPEDIMEFLCTGLIEDRDRIGLDVERYFWIFTRMVENIMCHKKLLNVRGRIKQPYPDT